MTMRLHSYAANPNPNLNPTGLCSYVATWLRSYVATELRSYRSAWLKNKDLYGYIGDYVAV